MLMLFIGVVSEEDGGTILDVFHQEYHKISI